MPADSFWQRHPIPVGLFLLAYGADDVREGRSAARAKNRRTFFAASGTARAATEAARTPGRGTVDAVSSGMCKRIRFRAGSRSGVPVVLLLALLLPRAGDAAFPGGNGRIAVNECLDIVETIEPDGSGVATLFSSHAFTPAFSPDGKKIAYAWQPSSGWYEVRIANADGSDPVVAVAGGIDPDWSPDGTKIVYRTPQWTLAIKDLATGETTPLTTLGGEYDQHYAPAWDPTGTRIAFTRSPGLLDEQIWIVDADGSNLRQLTTPPAGRQDDLPEWSPSGDRILFERKASSPNGYRLFVVDADGGTPVALTGETTDARAPAWSPDGSAIAYARNFGATEELWITTPAGGDGQSKATLGCVASRLDWQPLISVFVVNSPEATADATPGDGLCDTGAVLANGTAKCTLAAAVGESNAAPDFNRIVFDMPVGYADGPKDGLELSAPVTIDGTTQPGQVRVSVLTNLRVTAPGCTLRGLRIPNPDNLTSPAVELLGGGTVLEGNVIGINGTFGSGLAGILVASAGNRIGGTDHDPDVCNRQCNVISGSTRWGYGVRLDGFVASGNVIAGNFIGPDAEGDGVPPDDPVQHYGTQPVGVDLRAGADGNIIGGAAAGAGNVISGNADYGVHVEGGGRNRIEGNRIGTDATGTSALGGQAAGVVIVDSAENVVAGNVIGGHPTLPAILVTGSASADNDVRDNRLGTAADGTTPLPNSHGVLVQEGAIRTEIDANVIANNGVGVLVVGSTKAVVTDNDVHDGIEGIRFEAGVSDSFIVGNTIHDNGVGVALPGVAGDGTVRNWIASNEIFDNDGAGGSGLAIDLGAPGPTANDVGDADAGPNELMNFPTLDWAVVDAGGDVSVHGALGTEIGARSYWIQLFANAECDPSGHGEAARYVGDAFVTSDLAGTARFDAKLLGVGVAAGESISATATDDQGNTSELSRCRAVEFGVAVTERALAGASEVSVASTAGLAVGDRVIVCPGCPNEETNVVAGFGSLLLAAPLVFTHEVGELVARSATPLDPFTAWSVAITKGVVKPAAIGPVVLADRYGSAGYDVTKLAPLHAPAGVNGVPPLDEVVHLEAWAVKAAKGEPKFVQRSDVRAVSACADAFLQLKKPASLLVPATTSRTDPVVAPDPSAHERDHYLCYPATLEKKRADGTPVAALPKAMQVDASDGFQMRRYDLDKVTRLCQPVAKSGSPVVLKGPGAGTPVPLAPADVRHPFDHLLCFQAKLATRFVAQSGCVPADPADKGVKIDPKQASATVRGLHVTSQLGATQADTKKVVEICLPATSPEAGVTVP